MNDSELLQAWATQRDETAFAQLVSRHLDTVYAAARRQVGPSPLADDVAQAVFLVLARKAGSLSPRVVLSGWLLRTTRFVAARALRAEQRRSQHETLASMQTTLSDLPNPPEPWSSVEPHLDAALAALPTGDRDAILLRFFEHQSFRTVGERLGINEEAAKKRVSRAVEKLRHWLAKRGVTLTAASLLVLLGNLPTTAAPSSLARQIALAATAKVPASVASLATGAVRDVWLASLRRFQPWAIAALLVIMGVARWHSLHSRPSHDLTSPVAASPESIPVAQLSATTSTLSPAQPGPSKILLTVRSSAGNQALSAPVSASIWGDRRRLGTVDFHTDERGYVEIPVNGVEVSAVFVTVSAAGHVPQMISWKRHEFVEPFLPYQCVLEPGQLLEGVVQDEQGRPVNNAQVILHGPGFDLGERANIAYSPRFTAVTTDSAGRFRSDQLPNLRGNQSHMSYSVLHPDFVRARRWLDGAVSLSTNHQVVLQTGLWVAGRVEDEDQNPVPDATLVESGTHGGDERKAVSGPEGRFVIGPFPAEPVKLEVRAEGFKSSEQEVSVGAKAEELVVRLSLPDGSKTDWEQGWEAAKTVRITGTVVDAESGEAVPQFRVRLLEHRGTALNFLGEGHQGRFDWPVHMAFHHQFSLEVEGDGYEPAVSDIRPVGDDDQAFAFRLKRGGSVVGRVVDGSGHPVAGAVVGLNGLGFGFIVRGAGAFSSADAPQAITEADGKFSLRLKPNSTSLVVVHESGFAQVPVAGANLPTINLRPWGAIEGVMITAGQPTPNQSVLLQPWYPDHESGPTPALVSDSVMTDDAGRFRFDHVPPGPVAVCRVYKYSPGETGIVGHGPIQRVEVPSGGVAEVTLALTGRAVTGRFELAQPIAGYDWRLDLQTLEQVRADLPPVEIRDHPGSPEFQKMALKRARRERQIHKFYPDIQPDGTFHLHDVPGGSYMLKIRLTAPPKDSDEDGQAWDRPELGKLEVPVVIPAGSFNDPPVDLGTIRIPVQQP
ncbi:MAG: sigma-70 family RNA polymerase sigma factor [Verrucomicrobia bacterium]|nr:sigma-70 family RNA polymerase sigma factor [Verrucomicrobiota bacterium]